MRSDIIRIDNHGRGFKECVDMTADYARAHNLSNKQRLQLQILTNEMLSLTSAIAGNLRASFFIENDEKAFKQIITTKVALDDDTRYALLKKAAAAGDNKPTTFLGVLGNAFEQAMTSDSNNICYDLSSAKNSSDQDGLEMSIMLGIADDIKITINGMEVRMTVYKQFSD